MTKIERNSTCPCGSGLKYKKCCLQKKGLAKHNVSVMNSGAVSSLSSKFLGKKITSEKEDA